MKVTVFTSNQPRHMSLITHLAAVVDEVYAVCECTTLFPGKVKDYYAVSPVMERYFGEVRAAEQEVFGHVKFPPSNVRILPLFLDDLSKLPSAVLEPALLSDVYIVFGASYIRGELCARLIKNRAVNIHMGTSPYYRGSACNFWALHDGRADYVGATIHMLSAGLDSGAILFHALPAPAPLDPFILGMRSVKVAHEALCERIRAGALWNRAPVPQDRGLEIRYTRNRDFTDDVAKAYLNQMPTPQAVNAALRERDLSKFIDPVLK
jgi:hypothetical protein